MTEDAPKSFPITIRAAPRIGNVYWCQFHNANAIHLPEIWKTRPVIVVSKRNYIKGKVMVLPFSTAISNRNNKFAISLSKEIISQIDGLESWVLCDHIITVSTSRLRQVNGKVPRIKGELLGNILSTMLDCLGTPIKSLTNNQIEGNKEGLARQNLLSPPNVN